MTGLGGGGCPPFNFESKKGTKTSDFESNSVTIYSNCSGSIYGVHILPSG